MPARCSQPRPRALAAVVALTAWLLAGCALTGCGGKPEDEACWPRDRATDGGTVRLGIGTSGAYEPMPPTIGFVLGNQGGAFLPLQARIRALEPGDPSSFMAEGNPKTRFRAYIHDGTEVGPDCPTTLGYVESAEDGWHELGRSIDLEFLPLAVAENAYDSEIRLTVEVIDGDRMVASDEVVVFATAPPPSPDAGPIDAADE